MPQNVSRSLAVIVGLMPPALLGVLDLAAVAAVVSVHEVTEIVSVAHGVRAGRARPPFPAPAISARTWTGRAVP
ncbi:hypothetical protein ABZV34_34005 [Streptomyces sp. NPDC005195]|uniref:hypothetical protein n=1 Tax=Streptomyces sp. NPDC005195 TaxID=3154561 RepID=UPI0033BECB76